MTECERLIANGTFTRDFFKPEVRCDFLVDEKRKKIWAIELDLLREFDGICKKHGLRYCLVEGSLLGAVRHGGMIPWDDDIDVGMPRKDYERLKECVSEFKLPYLLQVPGCDDGYAYSFIKVRNSNTTFLSKTFAYESFNQGICLDVFPFDDVVIKLGGDLFERIKGLNIDNSTCMRKSNPNLQELDQKRIANCRRNDISKNLAEIESLARSFEDVECDGVGMLTNTIYSYERHVFPKADFDSVAIVSFEGMEVPIPVGCEDVLHRVYGDWKRLPDISERGVWHSGSIVDPDEPYQAYWKKSY